MILYIYNIHYVYMQPLKSLKHHLNTSIDLLEFNPNEIPDLNGLDVKYTKKYIKSAM